MNEGWFGLVGVVVGAAITIGYNLYRDWRKGKDKYRVMLYEKRLEAHQKAYSYSAHLLRAFSDRLSDLGLTKELRPLFREAEDFYFSNNLYLDENSRKLFRDALSSVITCFEEADSETIKDTRDELIKAINAITTGIGMKHLEESKQK